MREIKFRGYAYRDDEWRHGHYITDGSIHEINVLLQDNKTLYGSQINIESLGQYVGLKDKNGVEIYEGDIIVYSTSERGNEKTTEYAEVIFHNSCFKYFVHDEAGSYYAELLEDNEEQWAEVIGNIYENKDLFG